MKFFFKIFLLVISILFFFSCNSFSDKSSLRDTTSLISDSNFMNEQAMQQIKKALPSAFTYEGDATDEMGNTAHYRLSIKSDFSSASIAGGPYSKLRALPNGMYQWTEGAVLGINLDVSTNSCTVYNVDGSYFCTLARTNY